MFEKELDRVRKQLKTTLATPHPYVPLSAILANEQVYAPYRRYFHAEVQWWVHEERVIRASNPRFDTYDTNLGDLLRTMDVELLARARFDHEELSAVIDASVKTRLNFLCRPRTTLKWFVFRGEPTKPIHEILLRLRYFYDYAYVIHGFEDWVKARSSDASTYEILSVVEFERILEKIDNDAILDLSQEEFVALMDPLFEFFGGANPELPPETVPTEAVIIFLDDKGAIPISQALERLLYREELRFLTRTKLIDIINDVILQIEAAGGLPHITSPTSAQSEQFLAPVDVVPAEPLIAEPLIAEPLIAEPLIAEPLIAEALVAEALVAEDEVAIHSNPIVTVLEISDLPTEDASEVRKRRIDSLIDASMRERIVRKLFDKREEVYSAILNDVLVCTTWKEAAGVLDRRFADHGVEPNASTSMEFAQALHRSFL